MRKKTNAYVFRFSRSKIKNLFGQSFIPISKTKRKYNFMTMKL